SVPRSSWPTSSSVGSSGCPPSPSGSTVRWRASVSLSTGTPSRPSCPPRRNPPKRRSNPNTNENEGEHCGSPSFSFEARHGDSALLPDYKNRRGGEVRRAEVHAHQRRVLHPPHGLAPEIVR